MGSRCAALAGAGAGRAVSARWSRLRPRFCHRLLLALHEGADAGRLGSDADHVVGFAKAEKFDKFEFPILILLATLGMLLMISANDMLSLYLGLELQSLALYVVAAINRDSVRSTEAGLKYFVLGALSSGMLLYGISLVYGFTGTYRLRCNRSGTCRERSASSAWSSAWCSFSPASPSRSPQCRSTCGRRTFMKARRPR